MENGLKVDHQMFPHVNVLSETHLQFIMKMQAESMRQISWQALGKACQILWSIVSRDS